MLVADLTENLLLIGFFECPAFRQECVVEDICNLCLEAHCFHDFAQYGAPKVAEHDRLTCVRVFVFLEGRWVEKTRADEIFSQLNFFFDELGKR